MTTLSLQIAKSNSINQFYITLVLMEKYLAKSQINYIFNRQSYFALLKL